jgi:hypothetical protein
LDRGILVCLKAKELPRHFRQAIVFEHTFDECRDVLPAGGADDTKLSGIIPESIGELRLHADQAFPARSSTCRPLAVPSISIIAEKKLPDRPDR